MSSGRICGGCGIEVDAGEVLCDSCQAAGFGDTQEDVADGEVIPAPDPRPWWVDEGVLTEAVLIERALRGRGTA